MIFEKVAALLADYKGIDVNTITMDSSFAELELDSSTWPTSSCRSRTNWA
mgnify:CR=1 FL=1